MFRRASECVRSEFPFGRSYVHACGRFRVSGSEGPRRWTAGQTANLFQSDASPQTQWREKRLRSQTLHPFLALFQGKIRSWPCEFKGDNCRHNNDTNHCPVFLRLSSDLPVLPVELFTVRWVDRPPPAAPRCAADLSSARTATHPSIIHTFPHLLLSFAFTGGIWGLGRTAQDIFDRESRLPTMLVTCNRHIGETFTWCRGAGVIFTCSRNATWKNLSDSPALCSPCTERHCWIWREMRAFHGQDTCPRRSLDARRGATTGYCASGFPPVEKQCLVCNKSCFMSLF